MKRFIFLFAFVLFPAVASAQMDEYLNMAENFRFQVKAIHDIRSLDDLENNYEGSILLFEDWTPAVVTMKSGREDHLMMNYFIFDNSLIYLKGKDTVMTFALTDRIKDIQIGHRKFEPVTYTDNNSARVNTGVFEVVYKGNPMSIVKKYNSEFKPGQDASGYKNATRPTVITKSALYYQPLNTTMSYPVPTKKKDFYSMFGDKAKQVEEFAKKNKLRINENGIIKMAEYYNSLK